MCHPNGAREEGWAVAPRTEVSGTVLRLAMGTSCHELRIIGPQIRKCTLIKI